MAIKLEHQIPYCHCDEVGISLQEMPSIAQWRTRKFELLTQFKRLAKKNRHLLFTVDARDYQLYGSGSSCLVDLPLNQRGALKKLADKRIRFVCGGKSNRYSGRFYYAKPVNL